MGNRVSNSGFELDATWALSGAAEYVAADPHGGLRCMYLAAARAQIGGVWSSYSSEIEQGALLLDLGTWFDRKLWVKPDQAKSGTATFYLDAYFDDGAGYDLVQRYDPNILADGWQELDLGAAIPQGATGKIKLVMPAPVSPFYGSGYWLVDDVSVEDAMAACIRTVKANIAAQLATITTGAGYNSTVGTVHAMPIMAHALGNMPAVVIGRISQEKSVEDVEIGRKLARATVEVEVWVEASTSDDELWDLAADVENCLETETGGNYLSLGWVDDVVVVRDEMYVTEESAARGLRAAVVTVEVSYRYDRCAA